MEKEPGTNQQETSENNNMEDDKKSRAEVTRDVMADMKEIQSLEKGARGKAEEIANLEKILRGVPEAIRAEREEDLNRLKMEKDELESRAEEKKSGIRGMHAKKGSESFETDQENEPIDQKKPTGETEGDSQESNEDKIDKQLSSLNEKYNRLDKLPNPTAEDEKEAMETEKEIKRLEDLKRGEQEETSQEGKQQEVKLDEETEKTDDSKEAEMPKEAKEGMNEKNRQRYEALPPKAKSWAARIFSSIYKETGLEKLVSGLAIWNSQRVIDANERKMVGMKEGIDEIDLRIKEQEKFKKEFESLMTEYKEKGMPGADNFQLDIIKIEREEEKLKEERGAAQTRLEKKEKNTGTWANKRNEIAERMIDVYNEKLAPIEKELSILEGKRSRLKLSGSVMESRHARLLEEINRKEERLERILELKERTQKNKKILEKVKGVFEKDRLVETLKKEIEGGRDKIREERNSFRQERIETEQLIAKADTEAAPHRDAKDNLVRVQERKSLEIVLEERKREERSGRVRETKMDSRRESFKSESAERIGLASLVEDWNEYVKEKYGELTIEDDFFTETTLKVDEELKIEEFHNIVNDYAEMKRISQNDLNDVMVEFIRERRN